MTFPQGCPPGYAIFGLQPRILTSKSTCLARTKSGGCLSKKDGTGITGLRLFCSRKESGGLNHEESEKVLQFSGTVGNWTKKLACKKQKWVTTVDVLNYFEQYGSDWLGIMQIRLSCNNRIGNSGTSEGQIFPYGNPKVHGVRVSDVELWKNAITCRNFVQGAKVQTDQDTDLISLEGLEIVPDMVGINDIQFSCEPYDAAYSELNICRF